MSNRLILAAILSSIILGCDENRIYETNIPLENRIWHQDSVLHFDFEISQSKQLYNLLTNVQYTNEYAYRNLYIRYTLHDSTGAELNSELLENKLFTDKLGKPMGSSAIGDIYELQSPLLQEYQFPNRGKYSISLAQYMRVDSLEELSAIGIRVEQYKAEE